MRIEDMTGEDDSNDTSTNSPDFFYWNVWGQPTDENLYFDIRDYRLYTTTWEITAIWLA